jgi:hypothetical protein
LQSTKLVNRFPGLERLGVMKPRSPK